MKYFISDDDIPHRKNKEQHQFVLPHVLKKVVYRELHTNITHPGQIELYSSSGKGYAKQKKPRIQGKATLLPITSPSPLEILGIGFLCLEKSNGGFDYIQLTTDDFTRYTQAYFTRNKTAKTVTTHLYNNFVLRFGILSQLLHDQGREFGNALFKYLANLLGMHNLQTTPYHPELNGFT